jgi:hypothetical protein
MQKRRLEKGIPCSDSVGSIIQLSSKKDTQYVDVYMHIPYALYKMYEYLSSMHEVYYYVILN